MDQLGDQALDDMYDGFVTLVDSRPNTHLIPARRDDQGATLQILEQALADGASE